MMGMQMGQPGMIAQPMMTPGYGQPDPNNLSGLYEIYVGGGTDHGKTILSCRPDGYVDLWERNDNSGRQLWKLTLLGNGLYNVHVNGGTDHDKTILSANRGTNKTGLWKRDDDSGR